MSRKILTHGLPGFLLIAGSLFAEPPVQRKTSDQFVPGVPVTFEILNVTPTTRFTLHLSQAWVLAPPSPAHGTSPAALAGLHVEGGTLTFAPPPHGVPPGFTAVKFTAVMELAAGAGTTDLQPPQVLVISEEWGTIATQGGSFKLPLPPIPPTCSLLNCIEMPRSCWKSHDPEGKGCYFYQGMDYCCTSCPDGCIAKP